MRIFWTYDNWKQLGYWKLLPQVLCCVRWKFTADGIVLYKLETIKSSNILWVISVALVVRVRRYHKNDNTTVI